MWVPCGLYSRGGSFVWAGSLVPIGSCASGLVRVGFPARPSSPDQIHPHDHAPAGPLNVLAGHVGAGPRPRRSPPSRPRFAGWRGWMSRQMRGATQAIEVGSMAPLASPRALGLVRAGSLCGPCPCAGRVSHVGVSLCGPGFSCGRVPVWAGFLMWAWSSVRVGSSMGATFATDDAGRTSMRSHVRLVSSGSGAARVPHARWSFVSAGARPVTATTPVAATTARRRRRRARPSVSCEWGLWCGGSLRGSISRVTAAFGYGAGFLVWVAVFGAGRVFHGVTSAMDDVERIGMKSHVREVRR
jgi:hypothetical protein